MPRRRTVRPAEAAAAPTPRPNGLSRSGVQLVTIGLVVLSLWLLSSFIGQVLTGFQMDQRISESQAEIQQIQATTTALAEYAAYVNSPAYVDKVAREQLGMAASGDTVIMPNRPLATPTAVAPTPMPVPSPVSEPNWRGWLRALQP